MSRERYLLPAYL